MDNFAVDELIAPVGDGRVSAATAPDDIGAVVPGIDVVIPLGTYEDIAS